MELFCDKYTFAQLVRACEAAQYGLVGSCTGCVFYAFCSHGETPDDGNIMDGIEDICEIESGVADG